MPKGAVIAFDEVNSALSVLKSRNGGFSKADPARLVLPPIQDPLYGFQAVNVEAQARSPNSLLNWMRRMIAVRKQHPAFGRGSIARVPVPPAWERTGSTDTPSRGQTQP